MMIAIQALEKRTQTIVVLQNENALRKTEQQQMKKEIDVLKTRLEKLEAVLQKQAALKE
jgi:polyhydroxyalkanoate synthesis regulator phasin